MAAYERTQLWPRMREMLKPSSGDQPEGQAVLSENNLTRKTSVVGWNFKPDAGLGRLVRARDDKDITAASDQRLWPRQILDFELNEGAQWTPEQIEAMKQKPVWIAVDLAKGRDCSLPTHEVQVTDEMVGRGDAWLSNEGGGLRWPPIAIADFYRAMHAVAPVPLVSPAEDAMRRALLHILGDMPTPAEDPWERCRGISAAALGYQKPEPMKREVAGLVPTYYDVGWGERRPVTQAIVDNMKTAIGKLADERDALQSQNATLNGTIERQAYCVGNLANAIAAKDARIAELKSIMASTPVAFEDPDAKPAVVPNPFRDFGHDPRRMGPL